MKNLSFHKSILVWFIAAFLVLTLAASASYQSFREFNKEKDWVDHTYMVIDNLKEVMSDLKDIQSSQRGYLITGHKDYLVPLSLALPDLQERFNALEQLVADNPTQADRLERVKAASQRRIDIANAGMKTFEDKGQAAAFELVKTGAGKKEMDEVRAVVNEMIADESHLLDTRKRNVKVTAGTTLNIAASGVALCGFIFVFVFLQIYRETLKRTKTEESLQRAIAKMEHSTYETTLIGKLSDYMQSCLTTEEASRVITNSLPQLLIGTSGTIGIFKNSRNIVEIMTRWGEHADGPVDFQPEQCWGLRRGRAHYYSVGGTEPCCAHFGEKPNASLCLPMQAQGETLGLFTVIINDVKESNKERVAFARRVSEQISLAVANLNLQNKLREQSIRDPLTKLYNRRYLETTLDRELLRAQRNTQPLSVLVLDIDYFKKFNDSMGHDAGDSLLAQFADLLGHNVRKEDIVCRYGGEEFVIVLPMANLEMGLERANKICEATRKMKVKLGNQSIKSVSVSVGVAAFPDHAATGNDLITMADAALYKAKHNGRDQAVAAENV